MTTNYWAHQDITRKNLQRAGGEPEMLRRLELQSVNPINRLVMVLFYQQVLSPPEIYWVFSCPNHLLNTCISRTLCLLNGFEIVCWTRDLVWWPPLSSPHLPSPHLGCFLSDEMRERERERVMTCEHTITTITTISLIVL